MTGPNSRYHYGKIGGVNVIAALVTALFLSSSKYASIGESLTS